MKTDYCSLLLSTMLWIKIVQMVAPSAGKVLKEACQQGLKKIKGFYYFPCPLVWRVL